MTAIPRIFDVKPPNASILAGLLLGFALILPRASAAAPPTTQASSPDLDKLAHQFTEVCGADFEFQKSLATTDWEGVKTWLIAIEPRRAGVFVVILDCRDTTPPTSRFSPDRDQIVWVLDIGKENEKRVLPPPRSDTLNPMPLACAGDTVILPIQLLAGLTDFRFSRASLDPHFVQVKTQLIRDYANEIQVTKDNDSVKLKNDAAANLRVVARTGGAALNEPGTFLSRSIGCVMEAIKAGKFNLTSSGVQQESSQSLAVEILPKGTPISVLVRDGQQEEFQAKNLRASSTEYETLPPQTTIMREGDQISVDLWGDRVPANAPKPALPEVTIKQLPFAPLRGAFPDVDKDFAK